MYQLSDDQFFRDGDDRMRLGKKKQLATEHMAWMA
jgi:hypothetical protein